MTKLVSYELRYQDDYELENKLAISRRIASEMEFLEGEIQRQLSINAIALTNKIKRSNYGQTIMALLYIMINIMGVRKN